MRDAHYVVCMCMPCIHGCRMKLRTFRWHAVSSVDRVVILLVTSRLYHDDVVVIPITPLWHTVILDLYWGHSLQSTLRFYVLMERYMAFKVILTCNTQRIEKRAVQDFNRFFGTIIWNILLPNIFSSYASLRNTLLTYNQSAPVSRKISIVEWNIEL